MEQLKNGLFSKLSAYGANIIEALVVFIIGWYLIKIAIGIITRMMRKSKVDEIIITFIRSFVGVGLKIILAITVISVLGIDSTSLLTVLATAGAAIVLGLKDSMSGIVSGITILFAKPFTKGDIIEVKGYMGRIEEIQLLYTILMTFDNKMVVIPNNELSSSTFVNYSHEDVRRVDLTLDVHYDSDIDEVKRVINQSIVRHPLALEDPEPYIRVSAYNDSSITLTVRVWTKTDDYFLLKDDLLEQIKFNFDKNGINIPYPQLDVHIKS